MQDAPHGVSATLIA